MGRVKVRVQSLGRNCFICFSTGFKGFTGNNLPSFDNANSEALPISKEDSKQHDGKADTAAGTFANMSPLIPTKAPRGSQHCTDLLSDRKTKG